MKYSVSTFLVGSLLVTTPSWGDLNDTDPDPQINFFDNTAAETDWSICTDNTPACYLGQVNQRNQHLYIVNDNDGGFGISKGFQIEPGAGTASTPVIHLDNNNRVGINTEIPVNDLHVGGGGQVRLDPPGTGGDWDLNPGFIGLWLTNQDGSLTTPVKFNNNAPTDSLVVSSTNGRIGLGTASPLNQLHVVSSSSGNEGQIYMQNTNGTTAERVLFCLRNNGKLRFLMDNGPNQWTFDNDGLAFNISFVGTGLNEFRVTNTGNGFFRGNSFALNHINTSSRESKEQFKDIDVREILDKVTALPVSEWQYKSEENQPRHVGPVAEDFQKVFGLSDGKHISTVDMGGLTLAAIQGLHEIVREKDAAIAKLTDEKRTQDAQIRELNERLAALEAVLLGNQQISME